MNEISITLASDNNYAQHVAVVAVSVLSNTKQPQNVHFYLMSDGIEKHKIEKINATIESFGARLTVFDLSDETYFNDIFTSGHISKAAYFRLNIANLLPNTVRKLIYLDSDLLVLQDIANLWNFDLQGKPMGAVPDFGIMASKRLMKQKHATLGIPVRGNYFNSGVMVMDLDSWRKNDYFQKVVDYAFQVQYRHHDQDILNKIFAGNWCKLPLNWNVIPPVYNLLQKVLLHKKFRKAAIAARQNIAILHYAGRYKAWEFEKHERFNDQYYRYLAKTRFADEKMPQPSDDMTGKSIRRHLFKIWLADKICGIK